MISINSKKCIACGACAKDCFANGIHMIDNKPVPQPYCIECGHCIAICPVNAVTLENYDMSEVLEFSDINADIDPAAYLNHLKGRRSIRSFKETLVSEEQIKLILDAGRFSPTGGNLQNVSYYVSRNDINGFKNMLFDELYAMGMEAKNGGESVSWYSELWLHMYDDYKKNGVDKLFFDANTVITIASDSPQSACLAAAHMETMVYSLGLGMLYSGFSARAIFHSKEIKDYLHLKPDYEVYAVLVLGHPAVTYNRTVPRKPADVIWN